MRRFCGIGIEPALQMATLNPATALKAKKGGIEKGLPAELIVLDKDLKFVRAISFKL